MRSLNQFAANTEVFPNATNLPPFFDTNLVSDARVVKAFLNDPQAHIRIFYYQYLKLCFELENVDFNRYIKNIEQIINNPSFNFIFYQDDDTTIFNDTQAKSFMMEFFGILGVGNENVMSGLTHYPIMDTIFVHFFRSLMLLLGQIDSLDTYVPRDQLLGFLSEFFNVNIEIHSECIKYPDTDIYVYELNENAIFMAYMDFDRLENNQNAEQPAIVVSQAPAAAPQQPPQKDITELKRSQDRNINMIKDSYIASQFVDYTVNDGNIDALTSKAKLVMKASDLAETNQNLFKQSVRQQKYNPTQFASKAMTEANPIKEVIEEEIKEAKPAFVAYGNVEANKTQASKAIPATKYEQITPNYQAPSPINSYKPFDATPQAFKPEDAKFEANYEREAVRNYKRESEDIFDYKKDSFDSKRDSFNSSLDYKSAYSKDINEISTKANYNDYSSSNYSYLNKKEEKEPLIYNPKPDSFSYQNQFKEINTSTLVNKKKVFGLNVSDEFTNDDTIKSMAEPHRTNVLNIKARARNFRASLSQYIK